ncbi:MAG: hypothetical protein JKX90_07595 [Colwellia sp.]|nr:hypothetical protein [Colwellia sp.]
MKNTNAQTDKKTKIKIAIVVTTLVTGLFAIIGNNSIVQAAELIKAEPIKQINLYQEAKVSLALSFTSLTISQTFNEVAVKSAKVNQQNSADTNSPITLTEINLVTE